jgi:integrase
LKGNSIEDAKTALSKRVVQKRENRILDMLPESLLTFQALTDWYLELESVKALASYHTLKYRLAAFNAVFGQTIVGDVKLTELENYQIRRLKEGKAPGTVDHEIKKMQTAVIKAFDDEMIGGDVLRIFKRVKPTLKKGADVRDRILTGDEFNAIMDGLPRHAKPIFAMGYYTGMRRAEILGLTWDKVDMKGRVIRLEAADTKDKEARSIPICPALFDVLKAVPMAIHDDHVFLYRGKPITSIRRALMPTCKKAGVVYGRFKPGGFIFHDLRHTFNTNMRKAGVAESVIMAITGHSTREMFDRYNRVDLDDTLVPRAGLEPARPWATTPSR